MLRDKDPCVINKLRVCIYSTRNVCKQLNLVMKVPDLKLK